MPQYKLTYFDCRGLGETIRQLLVLADQPFEDVRIPMGQLTDAKKKELELEWGQVPILEIDGVKKAQSYAIARYLARKFNLVGKDDMEEMRCDEIVEAARDFVATTGSLYQAFSTSDKAGLEAGKKVLAEVNAPTHLARFENLLKKKGDIWLVGDKMSWADIVLVHTITDFDITYDLNLSQGYPAIEKLIDAVQNEPKIKAWLANRPQTKL